MADDDAPELAAASCDWRCLIALGVAVGETAKLLEEFGGVLELMPRPNGWQCLTADKDNWLLKLRCTYWTLKDQVEKDDEDKDEDDDEDRAPSSSNPDPWGNGGNQSGGTRSGSGSRPTDDVSSAGLGG